MGGLLLFAGGGSLFANPTPEAVRSVLQEWVAAKKLVSEEQESWAVEKVLLGDTIEVLRAEKELLESQISNREEASLAAQTEREELSLQRESLETAASELDETLARYEEQLAAWVPSLPSVLQEELAPLIRRLPEAGESVSELGLGRRLQAVVGILSQVDKFNSFLTYRRELRTVGEQTREADTLYFGLGGAIYADAEGVVAGYGRPGPEGWTWEASPENAEAILQVIASYKGEIPATYVALPLSVE